MKLNETIPFKANEDQINRFRIVSGALLSGLTVNIGEYRYKLAETTNSLAFNLIIILEDNTVLGSGYSFDTLFTKTQELTEDELAIIVSNSVINNTKGR